MSAGECARAAKLLMADKNCLHRWRYMHGVVAAYSSEGVMRDVDWNAMVHDLRTAEPFLGYLGASVGAVQVSSVQRKSGVDAMRERDRPTAIVSESRLVVGLVTAASWLGANIKAFAWRDLESAVRFLGVSEPHVAEITAWILATREEVEREAADAK